MPTSIQGTYLSRGNNLKTPKFYQMLDVVDYITIHGFNMDYDGSRDDFFGKLKMKDNTKLTNKDKEALDVNVGCRIPEEDIVNQISTLFYQNKG